MSALSSPLKSESPPGRPRRNTSLPELIFQLSKASRRLELEQQRGDLLRAQNDFLRQLLGCEGHLHSSNGARHGSPMRTPRSITTRSAQHFMLTPRASWPGAVVGSSPPPTPKAFDWTNADFQALQCRLDLAEARNRELEQIVEDLRSCQSEPPQTKEVAQQVGDGQAAVPLPQVAQQVGDGQAAVPLPQAFVEHVRSNDVAMVRAALESDSAGALLMGVDATTRSRPLQIATASGSAEVVDCLLDFAKRRAEQQLHSHRVREELMQRRFSQVIDGPHPDTGRSPLAEMMRQEKPPAEDVVIKLLRAKADLARRDHQGMTPFLECVAAGHLAHVQTLVRITQGTILPIVDNDARTALHVAAASGHAPIAEFLLKVKADPLSVDVRRNTPAALAQANGHDGVAQLLLNAVAPKPPPRSDDGQASTPPTSGVAQYVTKESGADAKVDSLRSQSCTDSVNNASESPGDSTGEAKQAEGKEVQRERASSPSFSNS